MAAAGRVQGWRAAKRAAAVVGGSCSKSSVFASCPAWAMAPPHTPARSPPFQVPPYSERGPPAGVAGRPRAPGRPHSPSLRRDVVRRLPVGSRLLPCLPCPGRVACALHAPAPQVRQVHVRERPVDGHRGTHHRRHPHKYGKCPALWAGVLCGDQRLPSGARGVNVLASFPPCPTFERVGPYPVSSPASGIPNVPIGCRAKRAFTVLSTWRRISQGFGVSARTG